MTCRLRIAALATVLALLAGCAHRMTTSFHAQTPSAEGAPRDPGTVAVYTLRPRRAYRIVAYVEAVIRGDVASVNGPALLTALRREAAAHGCEAIVISHGFCPAVAPTVAGEGTVQMEAACASFSPR